MASKGKCSNGALVFKKSSDEPIYGVVVEENFWRVEAEKENPEMAKEYFKNPKRNKMITVFILGNTLSYQFKESKEYDNDFFRSVHLQRFIYFNIEDVQMIAGGFSELFDAIEKKSVFSKKAVGYLNTVKEDLFYLRGYLTCDYTNVSISQYIKKWLDFYEKALPGLKGTQKKH